MMNVRRSAWLKLCCVAWLTVFHAEALSAKEPKRHPAGPMITVYTPHPEQLEIALDEIELEWRETDEKTITPTHAPIMIYGAQISESAASRATVAVSGITSQMDLSMIATSLKAANPGAEAHLILYEPGLPKNQTTRRLLTREVGLIVEQGEDPQALLEGLPAGSVRSVPGVPGGYVVEASDPISALSLADALRQRPGVRSAYPLLKQAYALR